MVCLSRCAPTSSAAPGQNCYTLPDASDPDCCNITVCDEPSLDPDQACTHNEVFMGLVISCLNAQNPTSFSCTSEAISRN